ncbi:MAG: phosphotransferase [Polyangiaceae bacterium]|nr:phosphotransferase [Polyangiaceae bacterium]
MDGNLESIATRWARLSVDRAPYGTGLINLTLSGFIDQRRVIVQRVHPAFADSVHQDIEAVTSHLDRSGVLTPRLVRTDAGALSTIDGEGRSWRVLTFIDGSHSHDRIDGPSRATEAGRTVGRFHAALADLDHGYEHTRPGIHDIAFRRAGIERAVEVHGAHPLYDEVARGVDALGAFTDHLLPVDVTPSRHAHGDLKTSNVLFDGDGSGLCLVDLDTLALMAWPFEMGDAIRSWCNPKREDEPGARVDTTLFEAALRGYHAGCNGLNLDPLEIELLPRGTLTIACELAMRFLTDALEERYFSFDPARFATRGEHNLARARGQLALARSLAAELGSLEHIARTTLR